MDKQKEHEKCPRAEFEIRYDSKTDRFRMYPMQPEISLDGLAVHIGRGYTAKAVIDIVMRHSEYKPVYERTWEYITAIIGQKNMFRTDIRMEGRGRVQLEQAVERETARRRYNREIA